MVTSRVSASATPSAVGIVTSLSSPAAVRPLEPRLTPRAGPPAEVGRSFAYGSTNPGHPQLAAAVTESPIPTTTAGGGRRATTPGHRGAHERGGEHENDRSAGPSFPT